MPTPEDTAQNRDENTKEKIKEEESVISTTDSLALAYRYVYAYRDSLIIKNELSPQEQQEIDAINFIFPDGTDGKAEDFARFNRLIDYIVTHGKISIIVLYRDFDKMELRHLPTVVAYAKKYKDVNIEVNELTGAIKYIPPK